MKNLLVVFSHGKESGPLGSKIVTLGRVVERLGGQFLSIDYRENPTGVFHDKDHPGESDRRIAQLIDTKLPPHEKLILIGSSMGGYASTMASQKMNVDGLFLLAPAFYIKGYTHKNPTSFVKNICGVFHKESRLPASVSKVKF